MTELTFFDIGKNRMAYRYFKNIIKYYVLSFLEKWHDIFTAYKISDAHEYTDYISKKLHHRIILSTPIITLLIIAKMTLYFLGVGYKKWLSIILVHFIFTDIALLSILIISFSTLTPNEKYYKKMLYLASFALINSIFFYIYSIHYHINYYYDIITLSILLFLWIFNYPLKWVILIPMTTISLYIISTIILIPTLSIKNILDIFILISAYCIGLFYSLMNGANEYHLFKLFKNLEEQSLTDTLTSINNRKGFLSKFNTLHKIAKREHKKSYIAIIDIDNFKIINDTYGHDIGDQVIISLTRQMSLISRRPLDIIARWGGEEFIMYWCEDKNKTPNIMGHKINQVIREIPPIQHKNFVVTVSIGITCLEESDLFDEAFKRADIALYKAKNNGKDQFMIEYALSINSKGIVNI